MRNYGWVVFIVGAFLLILSPVSLAMEGESDMAKEHEKSDKEWKETLTDEQYRVLRQKGTEPAFTGKFNKHDGTGMYVCAACGAELFDSETKYDSGSGWPSFWQPAAKENIGYEEDNSHAMKRTEVHCAKCGGHLGHVFDDGPNPTGKRYCINSASLNFSEA